MAEIGKCSDCSGLRERIHCVEDSDKTQWVKIDLLDNAISSGQKWLIGVLVVLCLNLIMGIITSGFVIAQIITKRP